MPVSASFSILALGNGSAQVMLPAASVCIVLFDVHVDRILIPQSLLAHRELATAST
jgi:hypothetical protein